MIIESTTQDIPGREITEILGLVRGNSVRARHVGRDIMAGLRNIIGGEIPEYARLQAETREVAKVHTAILKEILKSGSPLPRPACVLSGGETTVTIQGDGLGGRNQEFVLAAAIEIEDMDNVVCFSAGTDGTDGPTDAAGAIADGATVSRARAISLDPQGALRNNDSYHFFDPLGDLLRTGPTNTNVIDLRIMLAGT